MKKFFAIWCAAIIIGICMGIYACASAEIYPQTFVIINVDNINDTLVMVDFNDNMWELEGIEDWNCGDVVSAIMEDNNTTTIYDDIIVSVQYSGWFDEWAERICN